MSRPAHERLRDLENDVRDLRVLPAAEVRARGRRRGRRQMTALLAAGAVVATTAGIAATDVLQRPGQSAVAVGDSPGVNCVLALPNSPGEVRIRVLDGGAPAGLPGTTASQLRERQFVVLAGATDGDVAGAAALRYGPAAIGAAAVVRALVHGDVVMRFVPDRSDATIDLTLGRAFTRLSTATETNQNLATEGEPSAPPQCSAVAPRTR
jgi:LytR cell envelope-related transcriptional attenuator